MPEFFNKNYCLSVSGDFACFTRPEFKVERFSYDVITPSAARSIFTAIFWKPAFRWDITKIEVLKPIKHYSIRRNELIGIIANTRNEKTGVVIDKRDQRYSVCLKDVAYRLYADLEFINPKDRVKVYNPVTEELISEEENLDYKKDENPGKYNAIFERRARQGQYFNKPYLGCREFSVNSWRFIESLKDEPQPITESKEFGYMLYDLDYTQPNVPKPMVYNAKMKNGIIIVPSINSGEVLK